MNLHRVVSEAARRAIIGTHLRSASACSSRRANRFMGIRFLCTSCRKKIHVKDFLAGKRGICPKCGAGVDIPLVSQLPPKIKRSAPRRDAAEETERDRRPTVRAESLEVVPRVAVGRLLGTSEHPTGSLLTEAPRRRWNLRTLQEAETLVVDGVELRAMHERGDIPRGAELRRDDWLEWVGIDDVWPQRLPMARTSELATAPASMPGLLPDVARLLPPTAADTSPMISMPDVAHPGRLGYDDSHGIRRRLTVIAALAVLVAAIAAGGYLVLRSRLGLP